jgi:hypothetical protein
MLENGATAHGILESRSFESSENECSDARLETGAWALWRRALAGASVRKEVSGGHGAQG